MRNFVATILTASYGRGVRTDHRIVAANRSEAMQKAWLLARTLKAERNEQTASVTYLDELPGQGDAK